MKYSIIIPVYNAENTIRRCIDSLLAEHYSDMELILIDDGSTDSSGAICAAYAENHECVHYLKKENGGVSTARNAGLDYASGAYVLFVDSDDYVVSDFFLTLDKVLSETEADLIQFSYVHDNGAVKNVRRLSPLLVHSRDELMLFISDS